MANYTTYSNGDTIANANGANAAGYPATTVMVAEFDASKRNMAIDDTADVMTLPEGTVVNSCLLEVITGETDVNVELGTADDPNGFLTSTDCDTAGIKVGTPAAADLGTATVHAGDKPLRVTVITAAADTLKIKVYLDVTIVG
jgi:hypothetical protein